MKNVIENWGLEILVAVGVFFTPLYAYIAYTSLLVIADLITGLMKAKKLAGDITFREFVVNKVESNKLWRSAGKWTIYILAIMIAHGGTVSMYPEFELAKVVMISVAVVEAKSIDENIKEVLGYSLLGKLISVFGREKK